MTFNPPLYQKLNNYRFILASTSARRLEIIENNFGIPSSKITVVPPEFEENLLKEGISPEDYVTETAKHKALAVVAQFKGLEQSGSYQNVIILTSDTVIACNGTVFEKPGSKERQLEMFQQYRQYPDIKVHTSVHVLSLSGGKVTQHQSGLETTKLKFNCDLDGEFLQSYVDSEEGLSVAGGFKYQSIGSLLFTGIEGDYYNVVGLPVGETLSLLQQVL